MPLNYHCFMQMKNGSQAIKTIRYYEQKKLNFNDRKASSVITLNTDLVKAFHLNYAIHDSTDLACPPGRETLVEERRSSPP